MSLVAGVNPADVPVPYQWNQTRKLWTGRETRQITWSSIFLGPHDRAFDFVYVVKAVARLVFNLALTVFTLLYDSMCMAVDYARFSGIRSALAAREADFRAGNMQSLRQAIPEDNVLANELFPFLRSFTQFDLTPYQQAIVLKKRIERKQSITTSELEKFDHLVQTCRESNAQIPVLNYQSIHRLEVSGGFTEQRFRVIVNRLPKLQAIEGVSESEALIAIDKFKGQLREISIGWPDAFYRYSEAFTTAVVTHCPGLEKLKVNGLFAHTNAFINLMQGCRELRCFEIRDSGAFGNELARGFQILAQHGRLKKFSMTLCLRVMNGANPVLEQCPLTHLRAVYSHVPLSSLKQTIARQKEQILGFVYKPWSNSPQAGGYLIDADLQFLTDNCPNLRDIGVDYARLNHGAFKQFIQQATHLETLRLFGRISHRNLIDLVNSRPTLKCVQLLEFGSEQSPVDITLQGMREFLRECPHVDTVYIRAGLEPEEREQLAREFPEVDFLERETE